MDRGTGATATTASIKDMPALYQFDTTSLTQATWFHLPAASTCIGYELIVYLLDDNATHNSVIEPNGSDQIIGTSAAGDYIKAKAIDSFIHLVALASGKWGILNADGLPANGWSEQA